MTRTLATPDALADLAADSFDAEVSYAVAVGIERAFAAFIPALLSRYEVVERRETP